MASGRQKVRKAKRRKSHEDRTRSARQDPVPEVVADLTALKNQGVRVLDFERKNDLFRVDLDTSDIAPIEGGLQVGSTETVYILLARYPNLPPTVAVLGDSRFVGVPHVINGSVLCIYLDPSREWHPTDRIAHVIDRTLEWLDNAANRRADARTSLFHAVGGANPKTVDRPTAVMRCLVPEDPPNLSFVRVIDRTGSRVDVLGWNTPGVGEKLPAFRLRRFQPFGLPDNIGDLAGRVEAAGGATAATVIDRLRRQAIRTPRGSPTRFVIVVDHPTEPDLPCVVVAMLPPSATTDLQRSTPTLTPQKTRIGWLPMSDERPGLTTRRDTKRPAAAFAGRTIELWGCGGLGSWIGELVVRAHPERIVLRDGGVVSGGLLVRQNFTEFDVGNLKGRQLAERLRSLADGVDVEFGGANALEALEDGKLPACDLIIDATVNGAVAYQLDQVSRVSDPGPLLCQVATDRSSATLGVIVTSLSGDCGPATVEADLVDLIRADTALEGFHGLWSPPSAGDSVIPAPGCSTPTYHGAAADLVAVAGTMVSAMGNQLFAPTPGVTLIANPMSGVLPPFHHLGHQS